MEHNESRIAENTTTSEAVNINSAAQELKIQSSTTEAISNLNKQGFEQQITEIVAVIQPCIEQMAKAASNATEEMVGAVWEEFKGLTPLQKLLVALVVSGIVATGVAFSWEMVAGNWEKIKEFGTTALKEVKDSKAFNETVAKNLNVKKVLYMFEQRKKDATLNTETASKALQTFSSAKVTSLLVLLPQLFKK